MKTKTILSAIISLYLIGTAIVSATEQKATFSLNPATGQYQQGETFEITVNTDTASNNVVGTKAIIKYDTKALKAQKIKTDNSYVRMWAEKKIDTEKGTVRLVGGMPPPFYNSAKQQGKPFAQIVFEVIGADSQALTIEFDESQSEITLASKEGEMTNLFHSSFPMTLGLNGATPSAVAAKTTQPQQVTRNRVKRKKAVSTEEITQKTDSEVSENLHSASVEITENEKTFLQEYLYVIAIPGVIILVVITLWIISWRRERAMIEKVKEDMVNKEVQDSSEGDTSESAEKENTKSVLSSENTDSLEPAKNTNEEENKAPVLTPENANVENQSLSASEENKPTIDSANPEIEKEEQEIEQKAMNTVTSAELSAEPEDKSENIIKEDNLESLPKLQRTS